ncbi:MAG: PIN domain-containing protein [ANME-2 cluster archaeon]|nr:PIN domain-containing protein [ANME-2 cluster archaeon]
MNGETDVSHRYQHISGRSSLSRKADSVIRFFQETDLEKTYMTDLSLHSIGIILFRLGKYDVFTSFLEDMVIDGIEILSAVPEDLTNLPITAEKFNLDFDDTYQYMLAEKHQLEIISFDKDFDETELGRKEPSEIVH